MLDLQSNETILKQESVGWLKSSINLITGELYFTDKRIVFYTSNSALMGVMTSLFGLLGRFIMTLKRSQEPKYAMELTHSEIMHYDQGKHGMNTNVLVIKSGTNEFKFLVKSPITQWLELLRNKLGR